jgi:hypothetical protein
MNFKTYIILTVISVITQHILYAQENIVLRWQQEPAISTPEEVTGALSCILEPFHGRFRPLVCAYENKVLTGSSTFSNGKSLHEGSLWTFDLDQQTINGENATVQATAHFAVQSGTVKSGGVALAFDFNDWNTNNYVFAPGAIYNGNRFRSFDIPYPPYIYDRKDKPMNMPVTITNVPRLNTDATPARIELLTGNCSTPMFGFYNESQKKGWIMLADQGTKFGNSGFIIEENITDKKATFVLNAPGIREKRYVMCGFAESDDQPADFEQGDEIVIRFQIHTFNAKNLQEFFAQVFDVRKVMSGPNGYDQRTPFSQIAEVILEHVDKYKWYEDEKFGYICNKPESESPFGHVQAGWSGIPVYSLPQAIQPTLERIRRVSRGLDALAYMQAPTGLLYGMMKKGEFFGDNFKEMSKNPSIAMIRRSGESLRFGIQILDLFKKNGYEDKISKEWEEMLRKLANGLVNLWNENGQFGQFVDVETGNLDIPGSTAGIVCITGLVKASEYFNNNSYLEIAKKAGEYYYKRDISQGYSGGGPAEILQCPDSESTALSVEAYMELYESTGDSVWLNYARHAANIFSTWVVSYDYKFPDGSALDRIKARAAGSVIASVQNAHSAPGVYILSGDFLLKLYRASNNKKYLELLKDIAHNVVQYTNTYSNPIIQGGEPGAVSERVNLSDWEGKQNVGGGIPAGDSNLAWCTVTLLTIMQNPGIYIQNDTGEMIVFDHVNAEILEKDKKGITIKLSNPTSHDAIVSVFSESSHQAKQPMGDLAFLDWPRLNIDAGKSKVFVIQSNGKVISVAE